MVVLGIIYLLGVLVLGGLLIAVPTQTGGKHNTVIAFTWPLFIATLLGEALYSRTEKL